MRHLLQLLMMGIINVYRYCISPLLPRSCRFHPTCSAYAYEAIRIHGIGNGIKLAAQRLLKCHPWGWSGFDPVPSCKKRMESKNGK